MNFWVFFPFYSFRHVLFPLIGLPFFQFEHFFTFSKKPRLRLYVLQVEMNRLSSHQCLAKAIGLWSNFTRKFLEYSGDFSVKLFVNVKACINEVVHNVASTNPTDIHRQTTSNSLSGKVHRTFDRQSDFGITFDLSLRVFNTCRNIPFSSEISPNLTMLTGRVMRNLEKTRNGPNDPPIILSLL